MRRIYKKWFQKQEEILGVLAVIFTEYIQNKVYFIDNRKDEQKMKEQFFKIKGQVWRMEKVETLL